MAIDRRTFVIVIVIVVIAVPTIILVFHKSFFPIILSFRQSMTWAALTESTTGIPSAIMKMIGNIFK